MTNSEGPTTVNPARQLHEAGQSLWLDSINRAMLGSGDLARYVDQLAVTGLTSNPTILGHAMAASHDYEGSLRALLAQGVSGPQDLVYAAAFEDLGQAANLFRPAWQASGGEDGYVSVEVPPDLAYDAPATVALARHLHAMAGFPNLLVKVPGTPQGLTVLEELVDAGIGVNVTLLFSDTHYLRTAEAYMRALERRLARGEDLAVPSVASVFVSRWDKAADSLLPKPLHGRLGVAMAQKVYSSYQSLLASDRWRDLEAGGARPQRVLWASTSAKDPALPDTYYVEKLASPGTINTMPEKTLIAFADHGTVGEMLRDDYASGEETVAEVAAKGVDVDALGESLQRQGARAFSADWSALLDAIAAKASSIRAVA
jgi:transaldolase